MRSNASWRHFCLNARSLHECLAAGHIKCVSIGPRGLGLGLGFGDRHCNAFWHRFLDTVYRSRNLFVSDSTAWYKSSSDGHCVCANCVWKYHNAIKMASAKPADSNVELPPFMFRPVKEEQDWKHVWVISAPYCHMLGDFSFCRKL